MSASLALALALCLLADVPPTTTTPTTPTTSPPITTPPATTPPTTSPPTTLPPPAEIKVELGEASGVAALAPESGSAGVATSGRFVVVDDERGVFLVTTQGTPTARLLAGPDHSPDLDDLEGVCVADAPTGPIVVVVAEDSGVVTAVPLPPSPPEIGPRRIGVLAPLLEPGQKKPAKNKGWEGIAFLPRRLAKDGQDHLIAVHEDKPKAVAVFGWPGLEPEGVALLSTTPALDRALGDLSDVAVDPVSGEVLLLSDESRRLVRVTLTLGSKTAPGVRLEMGSARELPVKAGEKPEGITIDAAGAWWIVTDETGRLLPLPALP